MVDKMVDKIFVELKRHALIRIIIQAPLTFGKSCVYAAGKFFDGV